MKKLLLALSAACLAIAQEEVDDVNAARMRSQELERSQIMHTPHMLTNSYDPRVTGTPNHEMAAKRAASQLIEWGLKSVHLEPYLDIYERIIPDDVGKAA